MAYFTSKIIHETYLPSILSSFLVLIQMHKANTKKILIPFGILSTNIMPICLQQIDWNKVKELYKPQVATITTNQDFIRLLENMLIELHNGHSSLNVNLKSF
jgi:hypothetical protein